MIVRERVIMLRGGHLASPEATGRRGLVTTRDGVQRYGVLGPIVAFRLARECEIGQRVGKSAMRST